MRIDWRPKAETDLIGIVEYIAAESPRAALHVRDEIIDQIGRLSAYPNMGRTGRVAGTRELVILRTPFVVAYQVDRDAVTVLRVLHGARKWPRRF